jgi:hypothetical protein
MKICICFHWCCYFQLEIGFTPPPQGLYDKEDHSLYPVINASCKKELGTNYQRSSCFYKTQQLWNSHTNFIIMLLHFVLITKIFWNYLLRISQQIYANVEAAQSHLFTAYDCVFNHKPGRTITQAKCLFRYPARLQNLSWNMWC